LYILPCFTYQFFLKIQRTHRQWYTISLVVVWKLEIELSRSISFLAAVCLVFTMQNILADGLVVKDAFSRAVPPGAPMGAVYARLSNSGNEPLQIVRVFSDVAKFSEIHESIEIEGMMRMRKVEPLLIPALGHIDLQPGGKHVMLMNLQKPLISGDTFQLVFVDASENEYEISVLVGGFGQMTMP
jgi:copper(I)-binding protein